ncbi:lysozyme inhibitor LprI family protein [Caulobacter sp. KR2-114]|uniref:lysozyme inhibitor LprI family protein n=1 Tax=Caulobacter sp. KR2-114 TaxID=3400912 RepID=UPI003C0A30AE
MPRALVGGLLLAATLCVTPAAPTAGAAPQASFDCARAGTPTEKAICGDAGLATLDLALSQAYQARLRREPDLRQQQRGWLRARDAGCGADRPCMKAFIRARLDWMRGAAPMPGRLPTVVGQCSLTRESVRTNRFEGEPDSGSAAVFANGARQVSYDRVPGIEASRAGDPAVVCLASLPEDCPPGDERGKVYASADLRTLMAWALPDAEHLCGGA